MKGRFGSSVPYMSPQRGIVSFWKGQGNTRASCKGLIRALKPWTNTPSAATWTSPCACCAGSFWMRFRKRGPKRSIWEWVKRNTGSMFLLARVPFGVPILVALECPEPPMNVEPEVWGDLVWTIFRGTGTLGGSRLNGGRATKLPSPTWS